MASNGSYTQVITTYHSEVEVLIGWGVRTVTVAFKTLDFDLCNQLPWDHHLPNISSVVASLRPRPILFSVSDKDVEGLISSSEGSNEYTSVRYRDANYPLEKSLKR